MRCPCGYNFARGALAAMADASSSTHRSYTVVRDADWETVLAAEAKVLQATGEHAQLAALGDAAQWVGVLLVCPDCGRLGLTHPDFDAVQFFRPEDPAAR